MSYYGTDPKAHPFEQEQSVALVGPGAPYLPRNDYCRWCGRHRGEHAAKEPAPVVRYRLAWKSKATGERGHGEWNTDGSLIDAWVKAANHDHPEIFHWSETDQPVPVAVTGSGSGLDRMFQELVADARAESMLPSGSVEEGVDALLKAEEEG